MDAIFLEPWIPPMEPDLARLAMEAADAAGLQALRAWPEHRNGGVGFGALPPFLSWHGREAGRHHLVLLQAREVGALVPGARSKALPDGWLAALDLESLARPLAMHPELGGEASVQVVHLEGPGRGVVRTWGAPGLEVVRGVLVRLSGLTHWDLR
jgi:hypothetical protein